MDSEVINEIQELGEYRFEEFIADLWSQRGWTTKVTSGSGDRGIDIIATRESPFPEKHLLQVKCYSTGNKVGGPEVQQYASLRQQEDDVDAVIVITTSGFTEQAKQLGKDLNVKLIDNSALLDIISSTDSDSLLSEYSLLSESTKSKNDASALPSETGISTDSFTSNLYIQPSDSPSLSEQIPDAIQRYYSMRFADEIGDRFAVSGKILSAILNSPDNKGPESLESIVKYREPLQEKCDQTEDFVKLIDGLLEEEMPNEFKNSLDKDTELWKVWKTRHENLLRITNNIIDYDELELHCPECGESISGEYSNCPQCRISIEEYLSEYIETAEDCQNINERLKDEFFTRENYVYNEYP